MVLHRVYREELNHSLIRVFGIGAQGRNRTTDTAIFSRMLYQLSYLGRSQGPKKPVEPAGYSWREQSCLPRGRGLSGGFLHCAKLAREAPVKPPRPQGACR